MLNHILTPLKFDKEGYKEIAGNSGLTGLALLLIFLSSTINAIIAYLNPEAIDDFDFGAGAGDLGPVGNAISGFLFYLIFLLIFGMVLAFLVRGFGGSLTMMGSVRIIGFTAIWGLLANLVNLISVALDITIPFLGLILAILYLVAIIVGVSSGGSVSIIVAILALIIAFIITLILTVILMFFVLILLVIVLVVA
jgi:hypothetical protein